MIIDVLGKEIKVGLSLACEGLEIESMDFILLSAGTLWKNLRTNTVCID